MVRKHLPNVVQYCSLCCLLTALLCAPRMYFQAYSLPICRFTGCESLRHIVRGSYRSVPCEAQSMLHDGKRYRAITGLCRSLGCKSDSLTCLSSTDILGKGRTCSRSYLHLPCSQCLIYLNQNKKKESLFKFPAGISWQHVFISMAREVYGTLLICTIPPTQFLPWSIRMFEQCLA